MKILRGIQLLLLLFIGNNFSPVEGKVPRTCFGTKSAYSFTVVGHLEAMANRYRNCVIVEGNLEITGVKDPNSDLTFLKEIEVVTGYVLIGINYVPYIPLENLKIIRGQELFGPNKMALVVMVNDNGDQASRQLGVNALGFNSLTEIQRGNISINFNNKMCFVDTINWKDIMNPAARKRDGWQVTINNTMDKCPKCHESCNGRCWGPGEDQCQTLTSTVCHASCGGTRCHGSGPDECCDEECASGCTGPTASDCIFCLHVNDSGVCRNNCPPRYIYRPEKSRQVENADFKYRLAGRCVKTCPSNMLVEDNACVKNCREGLHNEGSGVCVTCIGNKCNKECYGVGNLDGALRDDRTINSKNIHFFEKCNIVRGNVIFQSYAFKGDIYTNTPPLTAKQVEKAFSDVKVITGYLEIVSWAKELHDFSAFSNLTTIVGNDQFRDLVTLLIQDSTADAGPLYMNQIRSLGFRSLMSIEHGNVYIGYMKNLCNQDLINWQKIIKNPVSHRSFQNGLRLKANIANCANVTCDPLCNNDGCWGPGAFECLGCRNLTYNGVCVSECNKSLGIYQEGNRCMPCDEECQDTCGGPGPSMCSVCKNYRNNVTCVSVCPSDKYGNPATRECLPCNEICIGQRASHLNSVPMCSGPLSTLSPGGCEYCFTVVTDRSLSSLECLPKLQTTCPAVHFFRKSVVYAGAENACIPCTEGCRACTGPSKSDCLHPMLLPTKRASRMKEEKDAVIRLQ